MKFKKLLLLTLIFCFVFCTTNPAFADGGIPLWIYTAHTAFGITYMGATVLGGLLWLLPILAIVIGLEILCVSAFFKFKEVKKISKATFIGNIVTTIIGSTITGLVFCLLLPYYDDIAFYIIGPYSALFNGYGLIIANILLFLMSFVVECHFAKKILKDIFDVRRIKIAYLIANIVSYIIPLLATITYLIFLCTSESFHERVNILFFIISLLITISVIIYIYKYIGKDIKTNTEKEQSV